jgi:hypothetical protein
MERDDLSDWVIFRCPDRCKQEVVYANEHGNVIKKFVVPEILDFEATLKRFDEIDKQNRIGKYAVDQNNPYPLFVEAKET